MSGSSAGRPGRGKPSQVISSQIKPMGIRSSYCLRHRRSRAVDVRNGGRRMRGLRGRAGDGYGAPSRDQCGTRAKYLGMQVLGPSIFSPWVRTPEQGYKGELGPPLGLGSEQPGKAHGPLPPPFCSVPCPALSCPALPRCYPYPIPPIHPSIHPYIHPPIAIIHGPAHGTMMHPYPYQLTAQYIQVPGRPECHSFPSLPPPSWNPSVCCQVGERACFHSFSIPPIRAMTYHEPYLPNLT